MELKKKLSQLRKEQGLTQLELAEALNVSRQAVSRWEVGTAVPSLDNLVGLSEVYSVSLDYLVHDEMEKPTQTNQEPNPVSTASDKGKNQTSLWRFIPALLGLALIFGVLTLYLNAHVTERNEFMDIINSVRASAYQPVRSAALRTAKESTFTEQARSYYGVSGSGGGTPIVSPLLRLSLDYNKWKETQPPQTLPDSQGPTEENLAYLRERYAGSLTIFRKMEALDTMFDMGIITREQRNSFFGSTELTSFNVGIQSGPLEGDFGGSLQDKMAHEEQNLYRLSPLAKSETLDDLFSWLGGIGE